MYLNICKVLYLSSTKYLIVMRYHNHVPVNSFTEQECLVFEQTVTVTDYCMTLLIYVLYVHLQ